MRVTLPLAFALWLLTCVTAWGQSGCCSSHGGVCGCACCDGTPLSDRCRPYFPCGGGGGGGGALTTPSSLNSVAQSSSRVLLSWHDNSSQEVSFRIEGRSSAQTLFEEIGSVAANTTSTAIGNLIPSTTYWFRIRAHNNGGDSPYSNQTTVTTLAEGATCPAPALCFANDRFKVEAHWQASSGASGNATVVRLSADSGYFWFFNPANVEAVFKVINACSLNNRYWFFAGGLTDVQTVITVTDTATGTVKTYTNPQGVAFRPIQDTSAFATCP